MPGSLTVPDPSPNLDPNPNPNPNPNPDRDPNPNPNLSPGEARTRSGSTGSISGLPRAKAQLNVKVGDQGGHTHELMLSVADQLRHGSDLTI